nr:hypothetical protein CFP56_78467 [Quercus suber]
MGILNVFAYLDKQSCDHDLSSRDSIMKASCRHDTVRFEISESGVRRKRVLLAPPLVSTFGRFGQAHDPRPHSDRLQPIVNLLRHPPSESLRHALKSDKFDSCLDQFFSSMSGSVSPITFKATVDCQAAGHLADIAKTLAEQEP